VLSPRKRDSFIIHDAPPTRDHPECVIGLRVGGGISSEGEADVRRRIGAPRMVVLSSLLKRSPGPPIRIPKHIVTSSYQNLLKRTVNALAIVAI